MQLPYSFRIWKIYRGKEGMLSATSDSASAASRYLGLLPEASVSSVARTALTLLYNASAGFLFESRCKTTCARKPLAG